MKGYSNIQVKGKVYAAAIVITFITVILLISCGNKEQKPVGLGYHAMAYDSESEKFIVYGGQVQDFAPSTTTDSTWAYNCISNTWTKMEHEFRPPKIAPHGMVYDSESDRIVLFTGETWTYDGREDRWSQLKVNTILKPLRKHEMGVIPGTSSLIIVGGTAAPYNESTEPRFSNEAITVGIVGDN
jgi:hypothetical protein